ncbi:MAG: ShlB/FhaC/HecB family hemolysin secretion/activation protein [Syntrophorhabdus aromaticivorans]|uniref:ShlB/FhaC/HecB family hemolysin secretion/activation protein n=1 Tax=Syntrophorhabdus aromaticivorans TaxID=328301 RepID=A0A971S1K4_9BACT|nr:ShlB/FhaC/HecB family hemolysin secretion/activation protein [Syntrophorhabdus aromaticivorans]
MQTLKKNLTATAARIFLLFALIITTSTAFAQVPDIGGAVKQAAPPPPETPAEKEAPAAPVIIEEREKPFSLPEGEKIFIKDFKLEGAGKAEEAELSALLVPYKGRELAMEEITKITNKLTLFCRDKGYLVAKAYVPKQDATDGILTIRIIMGTYGKFSLKNTSLVRDFLIQGVFDRAKQASPLVSRDGLERSMLLVRDMPGCTIPTVTIVPGAEPGTSDFVVNVDRSQRVNGYIMGDNQGSRYTGKNRVFGGIDINSPFGIGDKFSASAMTTNQNDGLQNIRLTYGFPLAYNGLRTEFAATRTTYSLGGIYSDLDATGQADVLECTISYPIKKSSNGIIDLSLNLAYKELQDDLSAVDSRNPRDAAVATLALQRTAYGSFFGRNLFTAISGSINMGTLDIRDETQKALNEAGANTGGTYSKLNLAFTGNLELTGKLSARASVKLQKVLTAHNVDSTEQLFISGMTGVKAYTESVSLDNGYVANAELRYALPTLLGIKHALGLFADNGWVYAQNGDYTTDDKTTISDVGLGYYMSFKRAFGSVQLAEPIGRSGNRNVKDPGTRVLVQVGVAF